MKQMTWRRLVTVLLLSFVAYAVSVRVLAASRYVPSTGEELDRLIPRDKWAGAGLDKLTPTEQQSLADEISGLLGGARSSQSSAPTPPPISQWRKLNRGMSKDEVKKLMGEPNRVSVSRFFESWDYGSGSITFTGKGRVDFWSEP
jgi:hypothetical protein